MSPSPSGQTILFGCPLELRTVGELKNIPLVLEYLLAFAHNPHTIYPFSYPVRQSTDTGDWLTLLKGRGRLAFAE